MNNRSKIIIALVALIAIILVPSLVIWKIFFATNDSGPVTIAPSGMTAAPIATPAPAGGAVNPVAATPAPKPVAVKPGGRPAAGAKAKKPPVLGGIPAVTANVPANLDAGPIADANGGAITVEIRRAYLKKLWTGGGQGGGQSRTTNEIYRVAQGTVIPTTEPSDSIAAPTLVTLHSSGTLVSVLEALAAASKVNFVSDQPGTLHATNQPIKIDADQQPFMELLAEICSQAALTPSGIQRTPPVPTARAAATEAASSRPAPGRVILSEQQSNLTLGPWVVSGAFGYMAESVVHNAPIPASSQQAPSSTEAQLYIVSRAEPKLRVLVGPGNLTLTEAVDDKGNSLLPNQQPISITSRWGQPEWAMRNFQIPVPLACPAGYGHTIVRLKATDHCVVEQTGKSVDLAIPTPDNPSKQTVGGMEVVASVNADDQNRYGNSNFRVTVTFHRGTLAAGDWKQIKEGLAGVAPQVFAGDGGEMMLQDIEAPQVQQVVVHQAPGFLSRLYGGLTGTPVPDQVTYENVTPGQDADTFSRIYMFYAWGNRGPRVPDHLAVDVPTSVTHVDVPVEFDNLPLP